jgi:hypothetical protein
MSIITVSSRPVSSSESERKRARSAASGSERQKILARARASEGALERARASGEDNLMGNKQQCWLQKHFPISITPHQPICNHHLRKHAVAKLAALEHYLIVCFYNCYDL